MKSIRTILENPPQKEVECHNCKGRGIVNLRGMVSSDLCPDCKMRGYYGKSGKIDVIDYDEWEKEMKARFEYDLKREII